MPWGFCGDSSTIAIFFFFLLFFGGKKKKKTKQMNIIQTLGPLPLSPTGIFMLTFLPELPFPPPPQAFVATTTSFCHKVKIFSSFGEAVLASAAGTWNTPPSDWQGCCGLYYLWQKTPPSKGNREGSRIRLWLECVFLPVRQSLETRTRGCATYGILFLHCVFAGLIEPRGHLK